LLCNKPKTTFTRAEKHAVFKAYVEEVTFPMRRFLSSSEYIVLTTFSMERKNKAEGTRKWREEQKEKKKAIKKAYYEKNKGELIQKAVERKKQKPVATKKRAQCRKTKKGGNGKSTARVCQISPKRRRERRKKESPKQRKVEEIPG